MDTNILEKLIKSIHNLFDLEEKKRELLNNLIEALTVKDYKEKNPEAKSVILACYRLKDKKTNALDKHLTYECVDSKDHKKIERIQRTYFSQYRQLKIKSYDLTKFIPDKTIATCQKDITKALN